LVEEVGEVVEGAELVVDVELEGEVGQPDAEDAPDVLVNCSPS